MISSTYSRVIRTFEMPCCVCRIDGYLLIISSWLFKLLQLIQQQSRCLNKCCRCAFLQIDAMLKVTQLNVRHEEVQNTLRGRYKAQREERSRQGGFKGQTFTQESVVCVP